MGQEDEREQRLRDLAGFGIDDELVGSRGERRDRPALPPGPLRRGDHRGRPLRAAVGRLGPGREPPARAEGAAGARHPVAPAPVLPLKDNVPTRAFPVVTVGLIAVNVAVWLWEVTGTPVDARRHPLRLLPVRARRPVRRARLATSAISLVRGASSPRCSCTAAGSTSSATCSSSGSSGTTSRTRSAGCASSLWYLAAGLVATGAADGRDAPLRGRAPDASIPNVGASGAIAGVLGAYLVLLPEREAC